MATTCSQCGAKLASGILDNRCPQCLLWLAVEDHPDDPRTAGMANGTPGGKIIGDFELIEEIARGGMGAVYKARQISLNRLVAIKMILAGGLASPDAIRRFRAEAEAAASLQHPNIVAIHEVGEYEGHQFFAMDYIEGRNLAELVRDHPLPARQAAGYLKTVAEAVHYAHQQGILHRDLKPSNVLIDPFDQPRITDFGLAKRLGEAGSGEPGAGGKEREEQSPKPISWLPAPCSELTVSGQVLGSPSFMPPEQAEGRSNAIGPAGDVYGLGALLYHVITGRPPFQAETLTSLLRQVMETEPVAPRLLNPNVPKDLETICLKCLEKEPARRYPSAQMLAEELGRFLAGEPVLAHPVGSVGKAWRWCRRQPVRAGLIGALVLVFLLGLTGILWQWHRAELQRATAQANELLARQNAYAADMNLAQRALEENNLRRVMEILAFYQPQAGYPDLRGWEWRYLWNQCQGGQVASLCRHSNTVTAVRFFPDGRRLVSAGCDRTIRLWDALTRQQTAVLVDDDLIRHLDLAPDGQWISTVDWRGKVSLWNVASQTRVLRLSTNLPMARIAFSPDGTLLAANGTRGLTIWRMPDGLIVKDLRHHNPWAAGAAVTFAPDGATLAFHQGDGTIGLMEVISGKQVAELTENSAGVYALAFSPNGQLLASANEDRTVRIWRVPSFQPVQTLPPFASKVESLVFSPGGNTLATSCYDRNVKLWNTAGWQESAILRGHFDEVWSVDFSPDGNWIATASKDRTIKLWNANPAKAESGQHALSLNVYFRLLSSDGEKVLTLFTNSAFSLSPTRNPDGSPSQAFPTLFKRELMPVRIWGGKVRGFAFRAKGDLLAAFEAGEVMLWDLAAREMVSKFAVVSNVIPVLCFSQDGQTLGVGIPGLRVELRNVRDATPLICAGLSAEGLTAIDLSADGRVVATGYRDWTAEVWSRDRGNKVDQIQGHSGETVAVAVSPDGRYVATASEDATVKLWDVDRHCEIATLSGELMGFTSVVFSPDGTRLVAGGANGAIKVWDVHAVRPHEVLALKGHRRRVYALAFADQGNTLYSLSASELISWEAAPWTTIQKVTLDEPPGASRQK